MNIQNAAAALLIILPVAFNLFFFSGEPSTTRTSCAAQPKRS